MAGAAPILLDQTSGFQHLQMLRYSGAGDRQPRGQVADGGGPLAQQVQNRLARGMRERAQQLHSVSHD